MQSLVGTQRQHLPIPHAVAQQRASLCTRVCAPQRACAASHLQGGTARLGRRRLRHRRRRLAHARERVRCHPATGVTVCTQERAGRGAGGSGRLRAGLGAPRGRRLPGRERRVYSSAATKGCCFSLLVSSGSVDPSAVHSVTHRCASHLRRNRQARFLAVVAAARWLRGGALPPPFARPHPSAGALKGSCPSHSAPCCSRRALGPCLPTCASLAQRREVVSSVDSDLGFAENSAQGVRVRLRRSC